jgi:hypothetical protein
MSQVEMHLVQAFNDQIVLRRRDEKGRGPGKTSAILGQSTKTDKKGRFHLRKRPRIFENRAKPRLTFFTPRAPLWSCELSPLRGAPLSRASGQRDYSRPVACADP